MEEDFNLDPAFYLEQKGIPHRSLFSIKHFYKDYYIHQEATYH